MPPATLYTPRNRLAKVVGGAGDPTLAILTARAETHVRSVTGDIRAFVLQSVSRLTALANRPEAEVVADRQAIGDLALAICEVAGAAGLASIGDVARGIRAMTDAWASPEAWHADAFRLHIDSLALLSAGTGEAETAAESVLLRLRHMRGWLGVPE
jgi:hypothetical protein